MLPGFDRLESFGHDELTAKHCYFRCSSPPNVDGIKIFDKDDHAGYKTLFFYLKVLQPGQKFRSHQHQEAFST